MGFWGNLAKFGLMAAPYAAAPFTGGLSIPLQMAIGAGFGAGGSALAGGDLGDIALGAGVGGGLAAIPGATKALDMNKAMQSSIQAGASGGLSTLQPGGLATMQGTPFAVAPPPPAASAQPQSGFWSRIADQAKEGMQQRDFWTTAAQQVAGGLEAARANRMPMRNVRALEYIAGGGREGGPNGFTRPSSEREMEEARKRLSGPGFWEQFLRYGVAPGLALGGSLLPPHRPDGGQ